MTGINLSNTYYFLRREKDRDIARINDTHHEYTVRSHYEHYIPTFLDLCAYIPTVHLRSGRNKEIFRYPYLYAHT